MTDNPTIYLTLNTLKNSPLRNELSNVLKRAGMNVQFSEYRFIDEDSFKKDVSDQLSSASCSVHILENAYGIILPNNPEISVAKYQFFEAKKTAQKNTNFKLFVWYPEQLLDKNIEPNQKTFINELRNNIADNTIFTTTNSIIQFAENIRTELAIKKQKENETQPVEIFFIANELDEKYGVSIVNELNKTIPTKQIFINPASDINYLEYCSQQIFKSKLTVIYFKKSEDWAKSFTQQIWKNTNGASSNNSILVIGEKETAISDDKKIIIPGIRSKIVEHDQIPVEINHHFKKFIKS